MRSSKIADQIRGFYHSSPFLPFDIVLTDGRRVTVNLPERIVFTNRMAAVVVGDVFDYSELSDVKAVEQPPPRPRRRKK